MTPLILGLVLFLGVHSLRIVAEGWRNRTRARLGPGPWKGLYTLLSLAGLALIVWGFGQARAAPVPLWTTPLWTRHLAGLLMWFALVLLAAAYVPGNQIKARLQHPMVLAVKLWGLAHLLANNTLADLLLFGSFTLWAVFNFRAARQRDRAAPPAMVSAGPGGTLLAVAVGTLAWALLAFWAHGAWFGVRPFGR